MRALLRGAFVIARRDFSATVLSRSFLLFLLAPLFPVLIGFIFGGLTVRATEQVQEPAIAVLSPADEFAALSAARNRLATALDEEQIVRLMRIEPLGNSAEQRRQLLKTNDPPASAVLEGGLAHPRLFGSLEPSARTVRQMSLIIDQARRMQLVPEPPGMPLVVAQIPRPAASLASQRAITAQAAQGILFVLTILLGTMLLSQLIEEKSNKIIEVLAAAVPVGAIFLGKLLAMLAVSVVGIAVWGGAAATAIALFAEQGLGALPPPAVGWPAFILFGLVYFAMSYLLLGAIFLGIGGHASTAREVQTLSMPVTMAQVVIFAIATIAIGQPNSTGGLAAAAFPLSSPYVMLARAAELPQLWPHLLAILWQLAWVAVILMITARLFRRSVLKSGPGTATGRRASRA